MQIQRGCSLRNPVIAAVVMAIIATPLAPAIAEPAAAASASEPVPTVPADSAKMINGVEVACTGVGQTRSDPRWAAYPVRVEFSGAGNEYLIGGVVSVSDRKGHSILSVACDGPWVLLKLAPGDYKIFARLSDSSAKPRSAPVKSPRTGQVRVVMQFRDAS